MKQWLNFLLRPLLLQRYNIIQYTCINDSLVKPRHQQKRAAPRTSLTVLSIFHDTQYIAASMSSKWYLCLYVVVGPFDFSQDSASKTLRRFSPGQIFMFSHRLEPSTIQATLPSIAIIGCRNNFNAAAPAWYALILGTAPVIAVTASRPAFNSWFLPTLSNAFLPLRLDRI